MRLDTWRYFDFWLLGAVAVVIIFSVAMIDSAIAGNPELIDNQVVSRQITFALIGFVIIILTTMFDYHFWSSFGRVLYAVVAVFLGFVAFGGEEAFGAQRWLDIGFAVVQPSELAKISIIVVMADFFARHQHRMGNFAWIIRSFLVTLGLVGLIYIQPDLSTSIVIMVIWFALLFASGLTRQHLMIFIILGLTLPIVSFPFWQTYQQQRVVNFLFADEEDEEARFGAQYDVRQALISIGSGGWLGNGYGQGSQVQFRFLKVRHSDFIYSAIAHEFGLVGTLVVMALLFFIVYRCLRGAMVAHDTYGALICYGVATLFAFQIFVNIGMNLKLMPVTGLPLPFVSQGGSSLMSLLLGIGLVESVVARQKTALTSTV